MSLQALHSTQHEWVELLQRDQGPKAACAALFSPVREPIFRMTGSTNPADLYLAHAGPLKGEAVGFPKIEMNFSTVRLQEEFRFVPVLLHNL